MSVTAPGVGTVFATRSIAGVEYPVTLLGLGASGAENAAGNPLFVAFGTGVSLQLATGSAAIGTVGVTGSVAVTGTFWQATQPVSMATLPALAAGSAVIGGVTQSGTWTVGVSGTVVVSGPLTDAQMRASPVPVTVTGGPTATAQTAGNASLASIDGKTPALSGGAVPVTDAGLAALGTKLDQLHADLTAAATSIPAGNNNIGDVDVASSALPTGASTSVKQDTGNTSLASIDAKLPALVNGAVTTVAVAASVLFAPINAATAGANNTLVAAVAAKSIRVVGFAIVCTVANTVTIFNGTTALTGPMSFAANGGLSAPQSTAGLFQTAVNTDLKMTLSAAGQVSGWLVYQLV